MLKDRLKKVREYCKISSQKEFAHTIGWTIGRIQDLESGKVKELKGSEAEQIQEKFLISGWWLLTGKGSMELKSVSLVESNTEYYVPLLNLQASAGNGNNQHHIEQTGTIAVTKSMFKTIQTPEHLQACMVVGDSMEPRILNGDYVIFEKCKFGGTGIYVLCVDGEYLVKKLERTGNNEIQVVSYNPAYPPYILNKESTVNIVGKMKIAICRGN